MNNSWGRWGDEDEFGALNFLTPEVVKASLGLVSDGVVISLAQEMGPGGAVAPHRRKPARFMDRDAGDYALGARAPDGFKFAEDTIQMPTHSSTHLDALSHAWQDDHLYNGHSSSETRSTKGAQKCGADKLKPIITRGVLIDMVDYLGAPLKASFGITSEHLRDYIATRKIELKSGDAILIRTGWFEREMDVIEYHEDEPGITQDAAEWLAEKEVSIVGSDNYAIEQQPSPDGTTFPVHLALLHRSGVPLLENVDLSVLSKHKRLTFLFVAVPLPLVGSTASPVTPLAIL